MTFDWNIALSAVSLSISGFLAFFYLRDRRHAKFAIESEYARELLAWHGAVVEVLMLLRQRPTDPVADVVGRRSNLARLSALIEQGRFYFPNVRVNEFGGDKPPAYRGYRNLALDFLVALFNLHSKPAAAATDQHAERLQRMFTSVVFEVVRPADRLSKIRKLTDQYFVRDASIVDLTTEDELSAISHIWDPPK